MESGTRILIELLGSIEATKLLGAENVNWSWCVAHATFTHRDACEFIVYIGSNIGDVDSAYRSTLASMREHGCTDAFVSAYTQAARIGALYVMFHA